MNVFTCLKFLTDLMLISTKYPYEDLQQICNKTVIGGRVSTVALPNSESDESLQISFREAPVNSHPVHCLGS